MKTWIIKGSVLALFVVAIWWSFASSPVEEIGEPSDTAVAPLKVQVLTVISEEVRPRLQAYGTAAAKFTTTLSAETEGIILEITEQGETGSLVSKGALLLRMDNSRQYARLKAAEATWGQMKVALVEESLRAEQARQDWKRAEGKGEPPAFLVRKPQLEAARRNLANAESGVAEAERDMARTQLKAPFNALITKRFVSPGTFVQPGTSLLELYSADAIEVRFPLSEEEWLQLPPEKILLDTAWPVTLQSNIQAESWSGTVIRIERHADPQTRQRALIVEIKNPLGQRNPLHPGTFVRAEINGELVERALKVPANVLTDRGEVWYVTENHLLARHQAKVLGSVEDFLLLEPFGEEGSELRILLHPMLTYLPGMQVTPVEVASDES